MEVSILRRNGFNVDVGLLRKNDLNVGLLRRAGPRALENQRRTIKRLREACQRRRLTGEPCVAVNRRASARGAYSILYERGCPPRRRDDAHSPDGGVALFQKAHATIQRPRRAVTRAGDRSAGGPRAAASQRPLRKWRGGGRPTMAHPRR